MVHHMDQLRFFQYNSRPVGFTTYDKVMDAAQLTPEVVQFHTGMLTCLFSLK